MIPSYAGGKFPLSTYLAERVREMLANPDQWKSLPQQVRDWLSMQRFKSLVPKANQMLVETFPRADKHYMVCYPFEGRLAHQTLGMLLTRRLERWGAQPSGFVASEYALVIWMVRDPALMISTGRLSLERLFDEDMLGDDLDAWLAESNLMKRTFRNAAIIAGLIERRLPGKEKTARQTTVNTDLIYDVLRSHQPDHILLRAAWDDAADGLIDAHRLAAMLKRIRGQIVHRALDVVSPLAVPVLLEIGREFIYGEGHDALLAEAANELIDEAMRLVSRQHGIALGGLEFIPDLSGALFAPEFKALLVADLHLEKGSSLARRGVHLPPYDTRELLRQLQQVMVETQPRRLIFLGDSFHDGGARGRIDQSSVETLRGITASVDTAWITGNHDPAPPADLGGIIVSEVSLGGVTLRHEPRALGIGSFEIAGHLHPAASVVSRGHRIRCRCFIADGQRLIMPAFGSYTGALNVRSEAFDGLFSDYHVWMLGSRAIHRFPAARIKATG